MTKPLRSKPLLRDTEAPIRSRPRGKRNPAQPQLLFDPMPERVEPALAQLKSHPPKGSEWSWELKLDGYRLAVHIEPQGIRILTRGGNDWTHRFPAIAEAARALGPATMIIDEEAIVLDEEGRPDSGCCSNRWAHPANKLATVPPTLSFTLSILFIWTGTICAVSNTGLDAACSRTR